MRYPQDRRMFSCDKCDKSFFEESPNSYIVCPDRLAVTPMTTYRLVEHGQLPAVKIGRAIRFDPDAVAAFLASVRVGPDGLTDGNQDGRIA